MTTVKELIEELQGCDQDAIVLYAYDEDGLTGVHYFIDSDFIVALDEDGNLMFDEHGELYEISDTENGSRDDLQQLELIVKRGGTPKPSIKLFSR